MPLSIVSGQEIRFVSEEIVIRITGDSCEVMGTYLFENPGAHETVVTLRYPFPVSALLPLPRTVEVYDSTTNAPVEYHRSGDAILFSVRLSAGQSGTYAVRYWQRTPAASMTYLLTTTNRWDAPLDEARFLISVPSAYELETCTYALEPSGDANGFRSYQFRRLRFFPRHDLTLTWRDAQ